MFKKLIFEKVKKYKKLNDLKKFYLLENISK